MDRYIFDELLKWEKKLIEKYKAIVKMEKERELESLTLMKKIEILKKVSEKFEGERKKLFVRAEINPLQDREKQLDQEIKSTKGIYYENKEEIEITLEYLRKEIDNDDESQQIITDDKVVFVK
ncbi:hypothetical protein ACWKTL_28435 [Bacillus toyonensis]|uniref:Uncharacterized protein n=1 Tax=Bacillus toyonensis TaxID=155322 RepID=A0AB73QZK7_9BACI|nr:hypothetical protein [Bacillus toyonensis]OTX04647.1 hypothetical protein BK712_18755 [Bacillus thuringiensis serovar seoulensis]MED3201943.1 hypothetical protein [Bacillus toyonensis]PEI84485.1 hypothetical protein CN678_19705 [Bacillus toyonensis]PEK54459.1 hypothetical protein CN586_04060 [Bacillus toyonensis]PEL51478.1 hypothetical protein CN638_13290 [Bacillus toyonensis]